MTRAATRLAGRAARVALERRSVAEGVGALLGGLAAMMLGEMRKGKR